jgi:hypothetical protein
MYTGEIYNFSSGAEGSELKPYSFGMNLYGKDFMFIPKSVVDSGLTINGKFYNSQVKTNLSDQISPYSKTFSLENISKASGPGFEADYKKSGFDDKEGYLLPKDLALNIPNNLFHYHYYEKEKKWYKNPLVIGAIVLGGAAALGAFGGAAGAGAAAGGAAGGTGLTVGAGGATGLTAGAAGTTGLVAPAGFTLAPGVGAAGLAAGTAAAGSSGGSTGLLDTAQFGQTGQTGITPGAAGQGLQVPTTPGLSSMGGGTGLAVPVSGGTVTQLGFVPTGATPVLGDPASFINNPNVLGNTVFSTDYLAAPGAATGMSASDALRLANQARNLLAGGQNPLVPQQQGLPQGGRGSQGVDYSGLLSLLQLQAGTPGVSSLTAPAQLRQIYQPTLLPNVLSLLG